MLEYYDKLISRARSINDVNYMHVAFGNTITPAEAIFLCENLFAPGVHTAPELRQERTFTEDELIKTAREWADTLLTDLRNIGKPDPEPFQRKDLRKSVTLYSDGAPRAGKSLLITLPGANFRLMMPMPTFLQNIDAATTDVMIIRDGTRSSYTAGLEGLASSVATLGEGIKSLLPVHEYDRIVGLGVSAGGLPIILLALQLQMEAAMGCGAGSPFHKKWFGTPVDPAAILRQAAKDGFSNKLLTAYGAQSPADRTSAVDIAGCLRVRPVEVAIEGMSVKHNILYPLSTRGELPAFLSQHLGI
jgi:hypothetical protein